jgi:hypothetical protein
MTESFRFIQPLEKASSLSSHVMVEIPLWTVTGNGWWILQKRSQESLRAQTA